MQKSCPYCAALAWWESTWLLAYNFRDRRKFEGKLRVTELWKKNLKGKHCVVSSEHSWKDSDTGIGMLHKIYFLSTSSYLLCFSDLKRLGRHTYRACRRRLVSAAWVAGSPWPLHLLQGVGCACTASFKENKTTVTLGLREREKRSLFQLI